MTSDAGAPHAWILARPDAIAGAAITRVWGLRTEERLARGFLRAGCERSHRGQRAPDTKCDVVVCRGDVVLDERLIEGITSSPNALLCLGELGPVAARYNNCQSYEVA